MSVIDNRFTTGFQVPSWDCGPSGRMFPVAMLRYFQEGAVLHSDAEDGVFDRVLDHGLFWAMTGMKMTMGVLPMRGEQVSVTTWHAGGNRLLFYRAYKALGEDGRVLASGVSSWALVNGETRRMVRASALPVVLPESELGQEHEGLVPERLGEMDGLEGGIPWLAGFRDLDTNGHVNNVRYAEWVLETLPEEMLLNRQLTSLELEFKSELRLGDEVRSVGSPSDTPHVYDHAVLKDDGTLACRARTSWNVA